MLMGIYQFDLDQELQFFLDERIAYLKENVSGKCASYIPELKKANPDDLGLALMLPSGKMYCSGDYNTTFTIQSISKVITFMAACVFRGTEEVLKWVDVEPTGASFNSILTFELNKNRKPYNPMINAGAITVASLIPGTTSQEKIQKVLDFLSKILGRNVSINTRVFQSEWETAHRNRALASLLMENELLDSSVDDTLFTYINLCSIEITVEDLAKIGLILSHNGYNPIQKVPLIPESIVQLTKVIMFTCGMYDASGKFAAFVGIPAKSGVSGGILGTIPSSLRNHPLLQEGCGIGIYGPAIDEHGNSVKGMKLLESFLKAYTVQVF